jgi:hypothetical protein
LGARGAAPQISPLAAGAAGSRREKRLPVRYLHFTYFCSMNFKVTPNNLARLEKIFGEAKYELRFEKGTFNSGYCVLEHKKVVVVNKFLNLEGRINTLLDILGTMQLDETMLTPESLKLFRQIVDNRNTADNNAEEKTPPSPEQPAEN